MHKDASKLQQKALILIERHLDQLLGQEQVAAASAIIIQNYAKTLAVVARDQREALRGFNPASLTDEELDNLARQAEQAIGDEIEN
jgi:uncharacterized protein YqeY